MYLMDILNWATGPMVKFLPPQIANDDQSTKDERETNWFGATSFRLVGAARPEVESSFSQTGKLLFP